MGRLTLRPALIGLAMLSSFAPALADGEEQPPEPPSPPTLFGLASDSCGDDYAQLLTAEGIRVQVRKMPSLADLSRIANLPANVRPKHLLFVDGYVVVDHIPPEAIIKLRADRPKVTGLVGVPDCFPPSDHTRLHSVELRTF